MLPCDVSLLSCRGACFIKNGLASKDWPGYAKSMQACAFLGPVVQLLTGQSPYSVQASLTT